MLVSAIQQSDSVIYTYIYIFFFFFFGDLSLWLTDNPLLSVSSCSYFLFYLFVFIFGCVGSSLLRMGFSLVAASGGYSSLWCTGFSLRWLFLLRSTGSRRSGFCSCGSRALEHRLSSCGAWASLLNGMWDLPRPGLEPVSPALAGGFLTTAPPGEPYILF